MKFVEDDFPEQFDYSEADIEPKIIRCADGLCGHPRCQKCGEGEEEEKNE